MADQARWFKLWCSAPADDSIQSLPPSLRWAWVALGAYTKQHGTSGVVTVSPTNGTLAAQLGVPLGDLLPTIAALPSIYIGTAPVYRQRGRGEQVVCRGEFMRGGKSPDAGGSNPQMAVYQILEKWCSKYGKITVTWRNWTKYQEDSTVSARGAELRAKKRREENRRDEKRKDKKDKRVQVSGTPIVPSAPPPNGANRWLQVPGSIAEALSKSPRLGADPRLQQPAWWQAHYRVNPALAYGAEVLKAEAWLVANPAKAPKGKDLSRFLHNWLGRATPPEA